jgi:hypothetical protein
LATVKVLENSPIHFCSGNFFLFSPILLSYFDRISDLTLSDFIHVPMSTI